MSINLRDYQNNAIASVRNEIRSGKKNIVLSMSTGGGKTVIASYLLDEIHNKGRRAIFVADRIALIDQTSATLDQYGIPHGCLQGQHWRYRPWERIQVASAQTLAIRGWPDADVIIVDECHALQKTVSDRIAARNCVAIGLTATPFTRGLGKHYDGIVTVTTTNKLIADKFLVPPVYFAASEPDMTGAKLTAGEWSDDEAAERAMPIVGDCVAEYLKHGEGRKFIAFGCTISHCEELQRQFMAAGVVCELYTCRTGDEERTAMVKEFRKPDSYIRGLVSVAALARGFDVSDVGCIIMARPLKSSLAEHIQILGRGLRIHEGKIDCIVLDHAGNVVRFWNQVAEFFEHGADTLDDGKKKEKKPKEAKEKEPMKCPKCKHVHNPAPACPRCGHTYPKKPSVAHVPGELRAVSGAAASSGPDRAARQNFFSQMVAVADERAASGRPYKDGWPAAQYKDKFGEWPNGLARIPVSPTIETRNWLRSRAIAFAKKMEAESARA